MNDALLFIEKGWPYAIVAAPGLFATVKLLLDAQKAEAAGQREDRRDEQQLIKIAHEAATAVIEELRAESDRLRDRLTEVEAELTSLRKEHAEMMANKDARIQFLEGEKRNLEMTLLAYEDLLRRHGIEPPKRGQPYWEMHDNQLRPAVPEI